jgi:Rad3-related DNA helicase/serine/threonine protein kinase
LGEGPTTFTYLYRHEQRKKYAVIKMGRLPLTSLAQKEEFVAYARKLKKLTHRHIVALEDYGLHPSEQSEHHYGFLVVQYIESSSLRTRFSQGQQLAPDEIRRILFPLADALQYANAAHIAHGNLHPGNILQTEKDVFLTDFSLPLFGQATSHTPAAFLYRAPEHLQGTPTAASDQYALAVMAYEWLCGRRPYQASTPEELLQQQTDEPIPAPATLNPQIKPALATVLLQALSVDPGARFPHTLTFSDAYLRALMGLPPLAPTRVVVPSPEQQTPPRERAHDPNPGAARALPQPPQRPSPIEPLTPAVADQPEPIAAIQPTRASATRRKPPAADQPAPEHRPARALPQDDTPGEPLEPALPAPIYSTYSDLQRRVEADLHQGGALSQCLPGYEERPAQITMAALVSRSLVAHTPSVIEAPTGTGKSLSYLIPVVRSGQVAIVSTANKALQEQLFFKDIPFVQRYIRRFDAALVKGMGNYICLDRLEQERVGMQHYARNPDFLRLQERIENSDEHFTGDIEMLGFPLPADIRTRVNADRDQCTWSKCSYFSECFVRKMKIRASQASVIVVNHTLLLLDASMEGNLLPERDVIVIDEAHHLEDEATRAFTTTVSQGQVSTLLAQHLLKDHTPAVLQDETKETMIRAWDRLSKVADPGYKGRANLKEPLQEGLSLASTISRLAEALRTGRPRLLTEKDEQLYDKLVSRAQNLADDVRTVFSVDQAEKYVYYVEKVVSGGRRGIQQFEVSATPLEVTTWLKEHLFDKANVICTSATLATIGPDPARPEVKGPNFAYFRRRVGLDISIYPDLQESILPLTFDYARRALLYLPRHLPAPVYGSGEAAQAYTRALASEMIKLVEASHGRAFLLFSSKRMLDEVFEIFARELPAHLTFPLLRQGDMTRLELVRSFRTREGAILFGLKSFWEGVDIAGEALSMVVIDKLPFDPPDDPVHEARVAQMKAAGENWFGTYVLPQAVLRLKQGLGRLLRTQDDRGVMAILDTRLHTKGYGKQIVQALPPARRTMSLEAVAHFFEDPVQEEEEAPF